MWINDKFTGSGTLKFSPTPKNATYPSLYMRTSKAMPSEATATMKPQPHQHPQSLTAGTRVISLAFTGTCPRIPQVLYY